LSDESRTTISWLTSTATRDFLAPALLHLRSNTYIQEDYSAFTVAPSVARVARNKHCFIRYSCRASYIAIQWHRRLNLSLWFLTCVDGNAATNSEYGIVHHEDHVFITFATAVPFIYNSRPTGKQLHDDKKCNSSMNSTDRTATADRERAITVIKHAPDVLNVLRKSRLQRRMSSDCCA